MAKDWIERINPDVLTKVLTGLLIGVVLMAFAAVALYLYQFHGHFAQDQGTWGQFGDYIGGVLNPLVSSIALLGLLLTVLMQRKDLRAADQEAVKARETRSIDLALRLEERFDSKAVVIARRAAAKQLQNFNDVETRSDATLVTSDPRWTDVDDIMNFFETVGTVTRLGHVDQALAYHFFFPWLNLYWQGARRYIDAQRSLSPAVVWKDAEWLYRVLCSQERELNGGKRLTWTEAEFKEFINEEATLSD